MGVGSRENLGVEKTRIMEYLAQCHEQLLIGVLPIFRQAHSVNSVKWPQNLHKNRKSYSEVYLRTFQTSPMDLKIVNG